MKIFNKIIILAAALTMMIGCVKEQDTTKARAILTSVKEMSFEGQGAKSQTVTVFADADWTVEAPEWITLSQNAGTATVELTVAAADNFRDGALDRPRKDTIKFNGYNLIANTVIIVTQEGDKFRDLTQNNLSEIAAMKRETFVYAKQAQVVAQTTKGFVATDESGTLYVESATIPAIGDKVTFYGEVNDIEGLPIVSKAERVTVASNAAVTYPAENNVTATFDTFAPTKLTYVTIDGVLGSGEVKVNGAKVNKCKLYEPAAATGAADLDGHKVSVKGYAFIVGTTVYIIPSEFVDNGVDEIIYFADNFEWFDSYSAATGAGDAVGTNDPGTTAPNLGTSADLAGLVTEFADRGYVFMNGAKDTPWVEGNPNNVIYIQRNYLKFGKTSHNAAIKLPKFTEIAGTVTAILTFDWCWQVTGGYKPDIMTLTVDIEGNGTVVNPVLESTQSQVDGESAITWQRATVTLAGIDANTVVTIRPTNYDPNIENPARYQNRWYLDNIKVVHGEGDLPTPPAPKPETPLHVEWLFTEEASLDPDKGYAKNWGTTAGLANKEAGDAGQYVLANVKGDGKITYVQIDKTTLDVDGKAEWKTGGTGHPFVYGAWPGDYWLFEATDGYAYPAGTNVNIKYITRVSKTGHKHWRVEYLDGSEWKPAMPTTKATINGAEVEYNVEMLDDGKTNTEVDVTVTVSAPTKDFKFRMVCVSNCQANGGAPLEAPNGGTTRIAGDETGTSPVIRVIE